jgi:sialic acid synthase SpsE
MAAAADNGVGFLSTPFDEEDADFLEGLGIEAWKVASGGLVEPSLLRRLAATGKPLLLSTGMATLAEVDHALGVVRDAGAPPLVLLQCHTDYPSAVDRANLRAMRAMSDRFDVPVGYSDHTVGTVAAVVAVALGAVLIEKHFTLDRSLPGPDQAASADPEAFAELVRSVRQAEAALGESSKSPTPEERANLPHVRRGIVAVADIPAGAVLSRPMLGLRRPLEGLPAKALEDMIGRVTASAVSAGTPLRPEHLLP